MAFLDDYYDHGLAVSESDTEAKISASERERLHKLLSVATISQTIPRRLGGDATPEELADDKRRSKRIAHVASQLYNAWGGNGLNGSGPDVSREAATVVWKKWYEEHRVAMMTRQRYIATWCIKTEGDQRWAKSAIVKINNELSWLEHALR